MSILRHNILLRGIVLLTLAGGIITLSSCINRRLTARLAQKAIEKECAFRDSSQTVGLLTGYYEVQPQARPILDSLVKAGLIKCRITEVAENKRVEKYTWWEGTSVTFNKVTHYFAEVSLTDEGSKYVVAHRPVTRKGEDDIPETETIITDSTEAADESAEAQTYGYQAIPVVTEPREVALPTDSGSKAYAAALKKVKYKKLDMLTGFLKVKKVFHIMCSDYDVKNGSAGCAFVSTFERITPFGRLLTSHTEGEKTVYTATLVRYEDSGWTVTAINNNLTGVVPGTDQPQ